jgi:methylenetetrahydrofolate dehydrogenase (NADP+)/methenyltetrahydrofolate cyclohydrolase
VSETKIIDGGAAALEIRTAVAARAVALRAAGGPVPGLAVVLVGSDPASQVYVRNKNRQAVEAGFNSFEHTLPADTGEPALLTLIERLNLDRRVHGILVQLPLPGHIDAETVVESIHPAKDVDGLHPFNVGRLASGRDAIVPCTPAGCLLLLKRHLGDLSGQRALVLGRSNLVGRPMAQLLLRESATVGIAHSRTRDLPLECRRADILVAAVGRPAMVRGDWIKPGATVIDVGINRVPAEQPGKSRLVGDVAFDEAIGVAGAITPVPGGIGPMTVAFLLRNTLDACCRQHDLPVDPLE